MAEGSRVLLYVDDKSLEEGLTEDLRKAGYLVDQCEDLETCQHVTSFYDHDIVFIQPGEDDLEIVQAVAGLSAPGARTIVVLQDPDPQIAEQLEMHGMQVTAFPPDSETLVELLEEDEGED